MSRNTTFVVTTLAACFAFVILATTRGSFGWAIVTSLCLWPVFFFIFLGAEKLLARRNVTILKSPNSRWICLAIAIILIIVGIIGGIAASNHHQLDYYAQLYTHKDWNALTSGQQNFWVERHPELNTYIQKDKWFTKWIITPIIVFFVLTAAIITGGVILKAVMLKLEERNKNPP
jgi:hypothetical protein